MQVKNEAEKAALRESGKMLATVLAAVTKAAEVDVTTQALADIASKELKALGGEPAFLNYPGTYSPFPSVICISVNDEVVHGIPRERKLNSGDVVGFDFGVSYKGMISDSALSMAVGEASPEVKTLLKATREALQQGIKVVKDSAHIGDIGAAVEARLRKDNLGVVEDLVGHGVGHELHEPPEIPNFGESGKGELLKAGMSIAIEPMSTLGKKDVYLAQDGWTVKTKDGSLSAHFEHTLLIGEDSAEIVTQL